MCIRRFCFFFSVLFPFPWTHVRGLKVSLDKSFCISIGGILYRICLIEKIYYEEYSMFEENNNYTFAILDYHERYSRKFVW